MIPHIKNYWPIIKVDAHSNHQVGLKTWKQIDPQAQFSIGNPKSRKLSMAIGQTLWRESKATNFIFFIQRGGNVILLLNYYLTIKKLKKSNFFFC